MAAARSPPRSEPANSQAFRPMAMPRRARSAALLDRSTRPSPRKRAKLCQRVVLGESGSGKSALLAAWIARQKDEVVFFHFTGATASSVSGSSVLRRLLETLRKRGVVPLTESVPQTDEKMVIILPQWLEKLSEQSGGILLFDAVNQLATARDRELWWWPERWPENIRVVFSTLPGDSLREMERRGWTVPELLVRIPLLQPGEKRSIMNLYLSLFSRALDLRLQDRLLAAPQAANPLFLRTVLDELRLRSRHEDLGENLDAMLKCQDPAALFVHVLKNLEQDFTPPEHPGLIHRALGLMGAALRGLSESEILQLLSSSDSPASEPLPRHYWAPLYLALEESLVSREGQLSFFHDYLRQAVWREYLDEDHELENAHGRLAETATRCLALGPFITTAQREIRSEDLPAGPVTARPACCGQRISIPEPIAERIEYFFLNSSETAYTDPALLLNCPSCGTLLRMNPFFIDIPAND